MPKGKVVVKKEICKGCGYCVANCPKKLMKLNEAEINGLGCNPAECCDPEKKCIGCAICATVCPEAAIEVYEITEEGKEEVK